MKAGRSDRGPALLPAGVRLRGAARSARGLLPVHALRLARLPRPGPCAQVYEVVIAWAHEQLPGRPIVLHTWSTNVVQLWLMEKLGFACVLRLSNDRGPGVDAVYGRLP